MVRALLLVLALAGTAVADNDMQYSLWDSNTKLVILITGTGARDINISGTAGGGGTITVSGGGAGYTIPSSVTRINMDIAAVDQNGHAGIDVDYSDYTSNNSYLFMIGGSNGPYSEDRILTGRKDDLIDARGGLNYVASGKGADYIYCEGISYVFSGLGSGVDWDRVYWDDYVVIYEAGADIYSPSSAGSGQGLTVIDSGPDEGWN